MESHSKIIIEMSAVFRMPEILDYQTLTGLTDRLDLSHGLFFRCDESA